MSRTLTLILFFFIILLILGCKTSPTTINQSSIDIQIIADPSMKNIFDVFLQRINQASLKLNDITPVNYNITYLAIPTASSDIASGKIKPDAWLTQPEWVTINNANVRNLGSPQKDCKPIFYSPIIFALHKDSIAKLEIYPENFNLVNLLNRIRAENKDHLRIQLDQPDKGALGLASLISLKTLLEEQSNGEDTALLANILAKATAPMNGSVHNLAALNRQKPGVIDLTITSEQEFNASPFSKDLKEITPQRAVLNVLYQLCRSDMDWISADKIQALNMFYEFLLAPEQIQTIQNSGFRTDLENLNKAKQFEFIELDDLLNFWDNQQRPLHLILIADTSASMGSHDLSQVKATVTHLLSRLSSNDITSLITTGDKAKVLDTLSQNHGEVLSNIEKLESYGGSAFYDSIVQALELSTKALEINKNYKNAILIFTDGPDNNSLTPYEVISQAASSALGPKNLDIKILLLNEQLLRPAEFSELKDFSVSLGVEMLSVRPENLTEASELLWRGF